MSNLSSTADDILASARVLIRAGGYAGFSYADIAAVVGIRKASIHHHFPSKVDLVCAVVRGYRQDAAAGCAALERMAADPHDQLVRYAGYWEACITDASDPYCICALLAGELPALPPAVAVEVRLHFEALSAWLTSAFERGAALGVLRLSDTPQAEAKLFMSNVHGGMLLARAQDDPGLFGLITKASLNRLTP